MKTLKLHAQHHWPAADRLPEVTVNYEESCGILRFIFEISEPADCFRRECSQDGDPCWQDSCAEVFLRSKTGYFNFECNSHGVCLGEFGQSRSPRRCLTAAEYAQVVRRVIQPPTSDGCLISWSLEISIPRQFIGLSADAEVYGNLYKCASGAKCPHYLCAFDIMTENPDFHRPEFFQRLI